MNWVQSLSDSIAYIEDHLNQPLQMDEVAKIANVSPAHYQRLFLILTNMTVFEYIRNRRLSQAGLDLCQSPVKVLDLALKYQYESAESFTRAFKKLHGMTPSLARKQKGTLKSFPPLQIQIILKGVESMNYRIEKKASFQFYGLSKTFTTDNGENFQKIPKFWEAVMTDGSYKKMMSAGQGTSCLGICMPMKNDKEFDYIIGAFTKEPVKGYEVYEVEAAKWAVFEARGPLPHALQDVWKRIFSEWFPSTGYEHLPLPELEVYFEGDTTSEDYLTEVWIPVKKA